MIITAYYSVDIVYYYNLELYIRGVFIKHIPLLSTDTNSE